ncbi:hypothetical protein L1049_023770 [Liquidambar formosana]|uniref:Autophagy protein ATG5 UblA domain-containing protein n=1 Tax=Liquidambar formosana TaxID=63359 RepID=A0AAP0RV13_LIQFO
MDGGATEAQRYVWEGAIPLQIHLHESEVTTLPPPPPALILAPRIGYLPLLVPLIKPHFSSALPPGVDTIWFDYKGLPLKWYIPTGVLFDLLCAGPERPWNLTIHFRGYPGNILIPCEGEDSIKWSFINSLKEEIQKGRLALLSEIGNYVTSSWILLKVRMVFLIFLEIGRRHLFVSVKERDSWSLIEVLDLSKHVCGNAKQNPITITNEPNKGIGKVNSIPIPG